MPSVGGGIGSAGADDETLREIFSEYVNFGSYTRTADTVDCTRFTRMVRHLVLVDRHTRLTLQDADIAFHQVCRRGGAGSATRRLDYDGFVGALLLLAPVAFPHLHPEQGLAALTDTMSYIFLSSRHRRTLKRSDKAAKQHQLHRSSRLAPTSLDRVLPRHSEAPPPGLFDECSVVSGASTSAPPATSPHPHPPPPPSFPTPPFAFPFPPPPPPTGTGAHGGAAALFGGGMPPPPPPLPPGMIPGGGAGGFPPPFPFGVPPHPAVFQGVPPTPASPTEQGLSVDGGVGDDPDSYDDEEEDEEEDEGYEYAERGPAGEGGLGWSAANNAADDFDTSAALLQAGKRRSVSFQVPPPQAAPAPSEAYLEVRQPLPLSGGGSLEEKLALEKRGRTSAGRTKVPRPGYHTAHTAVPTFRINTRYSTRASRMSDYHGKEVVDGMRRLKMIAEDESRQLPAAATAASAANSSSATILSGSTRSSGGGGGRPLSGYHFP